MNVIADSEKLALRRWAEPVLARISYKPGWDITIDNDATVTVRTALWPNVQKPTDPIVGTSCFTLLMFPCGDDKDEMARFLTMLVWDHIRYLEMHEMKEWFRVNGNAIYLDEAEQERFHGVHTHRQSRGQQTPSAAHPQQRDNTA